MFGRDKRIALSSLEQCYSERGLEICEPGRFVLGPFQRSSSWSVPGDGPWLALRQAWRYVWRRPALTVVMVFTLALGVGANTTLFALADALVFRALPFRDSSRLVKLSEDPDIARSESSLANVRDWESRVRAFSGLTAMGSSNWAYKMLDGDPMLMPYRAVAGDFFELLGVRAALGRALVPDDDRPGADRVVVLSHGFWQRQFGGSRSAVGRDIHLTEVGIGGAGGVPILFRVVGVMPAGFSYPDEPEMWGPLVPALQGIVGPGLPDFLTDRGGNILYLLGRLQPTATLATAHDDFARVVREVAVENGRREQRGVQVTQLADDILGPARGRVWALLGAGGLLLLVVAANVAGLMLVQIALRRREFAIRVALGAAPNSIARLVLAEILLMAALACVASVTITLWLLPIVRSLMPPDMPRINDVRMTARVLTFTVAVTAGTGFLCWMVSAVGLGRVGLEALMKSVTQSFDRRGFRRTARKILITVEVAAAVVLMTSAVFVLRSVNSLMRVDLGFQPAGLLAVAVELPSEASADTARTRQFLDHLMTGLVGLPSVTSVAAKGPVGLGSPVVFPEKPVAPTDATMSASVELVTSNYFATMRVPVRAGRPLTDIDRASGVPVVVVNETFARLAWPGDSPLGKRLSLPIADGGPTTGARTVVGVVADVRWPDLLHVPPTAYVPVEQSSFAPSSILVRREGSADALVAAIRGRLREINPGRLALIAPLNETLAAQQAPWRANLVLFGTFAVATVLLAVVGLYALLSSTAAEQTRELGLRIALGASGRRIFVSFVAQGASLIGVGSIVGVIASLLSARLMQAFVFEVTPLDLWTVYSALALVGVIGALACGIPALRASRTDPLTVLRAE